MWYVKMVTGRGSRWIWSECLAMMLIIALSAVILVNAANARANALTPGVREANYVEIVPPKYDDAGVFSEGMAVAGGYRFGYIDMTGREVAPPKYTNVDDFNEGMAWVGFVNGKYGYIDKTGEEVIPLIYDGASAFNEGIAWVKLHGKWGCIDKTGKEVIPLKYDAMGNYSEGLVRVKLNDKWGFISVGRRAITAVAVSQQGWPQEADTVVLAYANLFHDALAAAPLAYKENAPILFADNQGITPATLMEIRRLNPSKIILVGGTAVLSAEIENTLRQSYHQVVRYAGTDRYETAAQIAEAVGSNGAAAVVNGDVYQDAMTISSYAASQGIPILFTKKDALPDVTTNTLASLSVNRTIVTDGTGVVSAEVFGQLPSPTRYAGYDCYETAAVVAGAAALNINLENVYVVTGNDFAEALAAGNLAAHTLSPLIMAGGDAVLPTATENFFRANRDRIQGITIVGEVAANLEGQAAIKYIE